MGQLSTGPINKAIPSFRSASHLYVQYAIVWRTPSVEQCGHNYGLPHKYGHADSNCMIYTYCLIKKMQVVRILSDYNKSVDSVVTNSPQLQFIAPKRPTYYNLTLITH